MITRPSKEQTDREERINLAIAEWFEDLERGVCRGHREFLQRHSDISDELCVFLRDFGLFQRLSAGVLP